MKINELKDVRPVEAPAGTRATRPAATAAEDKVTLGATQEAAQVADDARQEAARSRAVRLKEVEAQVRQGTYPPPDPSRLANQILDAAAVTAQLRAMLIR